MMDKACVTAMSALCPLGDNPDQILTNMMEGKSAITHWRHYEPAPVYSKIGGEMDPSRITPMLKEEMADLPDDMARRLRPMLIRLPRHVHYSLWLAVRAWKDIQKNVQKPDFSPDRVGVIAAGHNLHNRYIHQETLTYQDSPDFVDGLYAASSLDSIHASAVSELLGAKGACYTIGTACASGIHAMRAARQELLSGELDQVYVIGAVTESALPELDNMVAMQAVAPGEDGQNPATVCRPFDQERTGFVPAHGGACLVLERRSANTSPLVVIEGIGISSDAQHLPVTSLEGQKRTIAKALNQAGRDISDMSFVSAHATSTSHGDMTELSAIRQICEENGCKPIPVNAPKSMLGHALWSAALLETAVIIGQLKKGQIHGNLNLENPDEPWMWDYCSSGPQEVKGKVALKNAFGFGGYNASMVISLGDVA